MRGKDLWDELERRAKAKYLLGDDFHLCGVDLVDDDVAMVKLARRGPRGGGPKGNGDIVRGAVVWSDLNERERARTGSAT